MPLNTLKDLFADQLSELYHAEKKAVETYTRLAGAASSPKLAAALRSLVSESRKHAWRLDGIFTTLNFTPRPAATGGAIGLHGNCMRLATMPGAEPHVRDAAIIAAAQRLAHDEIAGYGCARAWALLLDHDDAAAALQKTLAEEREADISLTRMAESVNRGALVPTLT